MEGHIFGSRLRILMRVKNEVLGAIRLWVEGTCTSCNRAYTAVHVLCTYYEEILCNRRCDRGYTTDHTPVCVWGGIVLKKGSMRIREAYVNIHVLSCPASTYCKNFD